MSSELRAKIRSAFADVGLSKVEPDLLNKCVSLASTLGVSAEEMAVCWEAFSLNKKLTSLDEHSFPQYRLQLIKDSDNADIDDDLKGRGAVVTRPSLLGTAGSKRPDKSQGGELHQVTPPAKRANLDHSASSVDALIPSSSLSGRRISLSPAPPASLSSATKRKVDSRLTKYEDRTNAGETVQTFNPNGLDAADVSGTVNDSPGCAVAYEHFETNVREPYRHWFTTLEERARALDEHLVELGEAMVERYGLGKAHNEGQDDEDGDVSSAHHVAPLEAVGVPRQEKICCIGRICNSSHEGRINATTVLLEGSRHESGGRRVEVDLGHLKENSVGYSLFPGQIVAVEGMNTSGLKLMAHRICEGAALPPQASTVRKLLKFHHDDAHQAGRPLRMMSVRGPYTTSDNLDYQPLLDLVKYIQHDRPDVVILAGPFVDLSHNAVSSGEPTIEYEDGTNSTVSFEAFFANKVAAILEELYAEEQDLKTQFVLVPSLEDATAEWVYPQPPFRDSIKGDGNYVEIIGANGQPKQVTVPGADDIEIGKLGLNHLEETAGSAGGRPFRRVHCVSNPCTLQINELIVGVTATDVLFHVSADETNAHLEPGSRLGRIAQHMLQQRSYYPLFPPPEGTNLNWKKRQQWNMPCRPDILIVPSKLSGFCRTVLDSTVVVNPGLLCRDTAGGTYASIEVHVMAREKLENAADQEVELQHAVPERTRVEIKRI